VKLTTSEAIVEYLIAQKMKFDNKVISFFPFAFAILGHGNALGLGDALERARNAIPTLRG